MKTVTIRIYCTTCDFESIRKLSINAHGYFELAPSYCPNDLFLLNQEIRGHIKSVFDEDEK